MDQTRSGQLERKASAKPPKGTHILGNIKSEKEKKRLQGEHAASSKLVAPPLKTQVVQVSAPEIENEGDVDEKIEKEDEVNVNDTGLLSFFGAWAL